MPSTTLTPTTHTGHGDQPAAAADYWIDAPTTVIAAGEPQRFTFRVLDPAGVTVTGFEDRHDRPMHLIVVSNDLRNVPEKGLYSFEPGAFLGRYMPDTFWFDRPETKA